MSNFRMALKREAQVLAETVNREYAKSEKDLIHSSYPRVSIEAMTALIDQGNIFTLEIQGVLICSFCLKNSPNQAELSMMAISEIHQGKGLGSQIVNYSIQRSIESNIGSLTVEVLYPKSGPIPEPQARLLQWYLRLGFQQIAIVDYDQLAMERKDSQKIPCIFVCLKKTLD